MFRLADGPPAAARARRYNDASVLENHHAATAFVLLERTGMLRSLSGEEFRALRRLVVDAILATDMSKHKDLLSRVAARVNAVPRRSASAVGSEADVGLGAATGDGQRKLFSTQATFHQSLC